MKKHRELCFLLKEENHNWLEKELNYSNGVTLISYELIEEYNDLWDYRMAKLIITSPSAFHEFMDKYSLWSYLYFYEDEQIVSITKSKYTGDYLS